MSSAGTIHHQIAEGYSGSNPVPTVQGFREQQAEQKRKSAQNPPPESTTAAAASPSASPAMTMDVEKDLPEEPSTESPHTRDAHEDEPIRNGTTETGEEKKGETKQEVMDKATAHKVKPTGRLKNTQAERTVRDPVTGLDVIIHDAEFSSGFMHSSPMTIAPRLLS